MTDAAQPTRHCHDCGAEYPVGANYCGQCGRRVGGKKRQKPRKPAWDKDRARGEYKEALARNIKRNGEELQDARRWRRIIYVGGFGSLLAWSVWVEPLGAAGTVIAAGGILFGAFLLTSRYGLAKPDWLTRHQYFRLHGADAEGAEMRCVNCGKEGSPWRRTVYQTNIVEARCPRCDTKLWWETN